MATTVDAMTYVAVTNIPSHFHACDLRAHFSSLVESRVFSCFHYRHRPERNNDSVLEKSQEIGSTRKLENPHCCCVVKVQNANLKNADLDLHLLKEYHNQHWTDSKGDIYGDLCQLTPIKLKFEDDKSGTAEKTDHKDVLDERILLKMPELNPPDKMPCGNVGTPTLDFLDLIQRCLLPHNFIRKLNLKFPKTSAKTLYGNVGFDYGTLEMKTGHGSLKPTYPTLRMSNKRKKILLGTHAHKSVQMEQFVGRQSLTPEPFGLNIASTSSDTGLDCELEMHDLKHSAMPALSSSEDDRTVSIKDVNLDVLSTPVLTPTLTKVQTPPNECKQSGTYTERFSHSQDEPPKNTGDTNTLTSRERKHRKKEDRDRTRKLMEEGIEENLIAIDRQRQNDDDAEEWDRHEASEDDPSNQERNKERLYEEEIEQPWEKGGPGVLFYTDAMYWQKREGDFDEQTTDDLDVDFSAYEETGAGDKDIRDFLKIRQETRFRNGYDKTDRFSIGIGKRLEPSSNRKEFRGPYIGDFEKHTKGIGRKVMEGQGWREGQGLGRSRLGIQHALKGEGQTAHNKQGLGFVHSKPVCYGLPLLMKIRERKKKLNHISTIYDDPWMSDPKEPLLVRSEPTTIKHRPTHLAKFHSEHE